jgi:hypothetical protein
MKKAAKKPQHTPGQWKSFGGSEKQSNFGVYKAIVNAPTGEAIRITADRKELAEEAAFKLGNVGAMIQLLKDVALLAGVNAAITDGSPMHKAIEKMLADLGVEA